MRAPIFSRSSRSFVAIACLALVVAHAGGCGSSSPDDEVGGGGVSPGRDGGTEPGRDGGTNPGRDAETNPEPDTGAGRADGGDADAGLQAGSGSCTVDGFCWESPTPTGVSMNDVWGADEGDVWAVGFGGALRHFDGTDWSFQAPPTRETLHAVHGTSAADVWAVGEKGTVLHFDGNGWSAVSIGTTERLRGVYALPTGQVWVTGDSGATHHYDGATWTHVALPFPGASYGAVQAFADDDVWLAAAGAALHWDGATWSVHDFSLSYSATLMGFEKTEAGALYAFVQDGTYWWRPLSKWNGTSFEQVVLPPAVQDILLNYGTVGVAGNEVWIVAENGIARFDGSTWSVTTAAKIVTPRALHFFASGRGVGVGDSGLELVREPGGELAVSHPGGSVYSWFHGIGSAGDSEWVGGGAAVLHRTAGAPAWEPLAAPPIGILGITAITARSPSSVWVTSTEASTAVLEWNGAAWTNRTDASSGFWMNTAHTTAAGVSYFGGSQGVVRWSDTGMQPVSMVRWITGIDSTPASEVWAVGHDGAILRSDGEGRFIAQPSPISVDLLSVHCASNTEVWLGGKQGALLRWNGASLQTVALPESMFGATTYREVLAIAGAIDGPHGLWVLVSGGEVVEMHGSGAAVLHSLQMPATNLAFTRPDELVVVGLGPGVMRKRF